MKKRLQDGRKGKDITGQRFGNVVALRPTDKLCEAKCRVWVCKCVCGEEVELSTRKLNTQTASCGCVKGGVKTLNQAVVDFNSRWLSRPLVGGAQI